MAWRIHDSVIRGEIDNRRRNLVQGRLWLCGQTEPVRLELEGNAAADLAGCLLTFENPHVTVPLRGDGRLAPVQRGTVGDLTASRKIRVLEMPTVEAYLRKKKGLPVPEHLANCIYLEWFSEASGRVVIESTDYQLVLSLPEWRLSPAEEEQRKQIAAAGFARFLEKLGESFAEHTDESPAGAGWDEFNYEQFLRESDSRTDKYSELLDRYLDHPDRDRIIAREMGWTWLDDSLDPVPPPAQPPANLEPAESRSPLGASAPQPQPQPDPATEGVDWVRREDGRVCHPLSLRALEGSLRLWEQCEGLCLAHAADGDLHALMAEYQITSAKVAGALDGLAFGRDLRDHGFIVARLKRALQHLHAAQEALENLAPKRLLPEATLGDTRVELAGLGREILRLMQEFRRF